MSRGTNVLVTVISASWALAVNGCSVQEGDAQGEAVLASESTATTMTMDGVLVRQPPADHPAGVPAIAATNFVMLSGEAFLPGQAATYTNSFGNGGACISSGSNALSAPVQLPQGAVLTGFKVFFNDTSAATDVSVTLAAYSPTGGVYFFLATLDSSGITGFGNKSTAAIAAPNVVDNTTLGYLVRGFSTSWNCNMHINAALITYSL